MRVHGRYSIKSRPVEQLDHQIKPLHWKTVDGYKLPIRGPFTQAVAHRGTAILYVSQPGEVPLYYSTTPGWIHWSEQSLALPGRGIKRINQGEAVIWTPQSLKTIKADQLPQPDIVEPVSKPIAIEQYLSCLIAAVKNRLDDSDRPVAVSQSGGIDSLMITWALQKATTRKIVPMTVCTGMDDHDISIATEALAQMGVDAPLPMFVAESELPELLREALLCFESPEVGNIKMSVGNILMARKCRELGIGLIFNGHAQDDLHGGGGLAQGNYKKYDGTPAERWRDARRKEVQDATGMVKMFASTFRRYGVGVRMPYYDSDLLDWAFSQPLSTFPVHHAKPFARAVACSILPPGPWLEAKYHSTGYITGAGFYEDRIREPLEPQLNQLREWLREIKAEGWQAIAQKHGL